jgi:shikimate kinase
LPDLHLPLAGACPGGGDASDMKISRLAIPVTIAAVVAAAPATAAAAEFEGTVVSVNRENRTFRIHDSERGTKRVKVNRNTRYERIAGFRGLRAGMTNIETIVKRRNGRWVAIEVERSGGGGQHGGDDD